MCGPASRNHGSDNAECGFTLVELSVVLVIIGLIVGGVLSGKELIRAATIRATIRQMEQFDTAANVFRGKFNGYPGDIRSPTNFGFDDTGGADNLIGNGMIDTSTNDDTKFDFEAAAFFRHLYQAGFISEYIPGAADYNAAVDDIANFTPQTKLGQARILVYNLGGYNQYFMGNVSVTNATPSFNANSELAVIEAYQIDRKMDDGYPVTGRVIAMTDFDSADAGAAAADNICVNTTPNPDAYNTGTQPRSDDTECSLRIRTSF